jgi:ATP-dependent Clp endopeptidase proteolytic subunit ClpP
MSIQARAVPSHTPPKSNSESWDATAAVDRLRKWASNDGSGAKDKMDWGKYESGFAWHDDQAGEHFGAYKLPHHDVEGSRLVVVWSGVSAAMTSLVGGRAGSIPEAERDAVYNHLKRHYAQFDQEPPPMNTSKRFWDFKPAAQVAGQDAEEVDLLVYGVIDDWPWGDVIAAEFAQELAANKDKQIHCRINSVGGEVFAGIAIHNMLQTHPGGARCTVEGLAASAASIIAMAGSKTTMLRGAMMMIHNPSALASGEASELRKTADVLDQISTSLVAIYQLKTGKSAEELQAMLDAETWMSAQEAVDQGFADEVLGEVVAQDHGEAIFFNGIGFPAARAPHLAAPQPALPPEFQPVATGEPLTRTLLAERAPDLLA